MSVYVDEIQEYPYTNLKCKQWCHMFADTDDELHTMATKIGLQRSWHQNKPGFSHYDLVPSKRAKAIQCGAKQLTSREMVEKARKAREKVQEPPTIKI